MFAKHMGAVLAGVCLVGVVACGVEDTPQAPPYPQPIVNPNPNPEPGQYQCPTQCPSSCDAQGQCVSTTRQCPVECPDDCDSFGVCNYELDPDARYRVDLLQASVTESGSRACSLTGMLGWARMSCDLYVIFRTGSYEFRSPVSRESSTVYGGVTVPDITLGDLEKYFEVRVMDENSSGTDLMIVSCRPDWTKEALEVQTISMQCGAYDFDIPGDEYSGSSLAIVTIRLTPLDGGAIRRTDGTGSY